MTDREVMQQALRAFNLYLDWDGKDSSMLATFDIAANIVKDKLNAALAQPEQTALQDATDAQRYRRIRNGPYSDRHGDVYAMTFQGNGDVPIKREELDRIVDAALAIAQPKDKP